MKYENSKKHKKDRDRLLKKTSAVVQDLLNLISIYIKQTNDINQIISSNNKSKSSVLTAFIAINTVIIKLLDIYQSFKDREFQTSKNNSNNHEIDSKLSDEDMEILRQFLNIHNHETHNITKIKQQRKSAS
ncbi:MULTISPECIES: hypothetical protein [unclassified Candidatus Lariskella]|uniref:hypothetical protein n=1 Tax=unclassified Candidatus Lariskella TaxID=2632605 RepID=UPI0030D5F810